MQKNSLIICFLAICISFSSFSQSKGVKVAKVDAFQKTRILFIVDCSNSMYSKWQSDTKIKIVQSVLSNILDTLSGRPNLEIALRAFGHLKNYPPQDCDDTRLETSFSKNNIEQIRAKLKALVPKGTTPLASTLEKCAEDFPECNSCRNIVVMISDGLDDCGGDACAISQELQQKGVFIKPFIVGIGKGLREHLECIGTFYDASNEIDFSIALNNIVNLALYNTTCQVNLLDSYNESTETNVPMIFYDSKSKLPRYSFIHTFNNKGISDTLFIDPLINYDIEIHTIPHIRIDNISLIPGRHTNIPAKTPQGSMVIKYKGKELSSLKTFPILVKKKGEKDVINIHSINSSEKYIVGKYDLEVMTMPRLKLDNIEVGQSSTTTIEIPALGIANINKGKEGMMGSLFVKENNVWEFVTSLNEMINESINLLPGQYMVVTRLKASTKTTQTISKEFKIESGQVTAVILGK